jgi:hypothetical protein
MSCFHFWFWRDDAGGSEGRNRETEPLLPRYHDNTDLQRRLHEKLHSLQMFRALSDGYMPSTRQIIVNLRTLLASDLLARSPSNSGLNDSSRALVHYTNQLLAQLVELLEAKNKDDQVQDFVWHVAKSGRSLDVGRIVERASRTQAKSHAGTGSSHNVPLTRYL